MCLLVCHVNEAYQGESRDVLVDDLFDGLFESCIHIVKYVYVSNVRNDDLNTGGSLG